MTMRTLVLYGTSSNNDLFYSSGFLCFDNFVFIERGSSKVIITSAIEKGRALKESKANAVYSVDEILGRRGKLDEALMRYIGQKGLWDISIPPDFPAGIYRKLRNKAFVKIKNPELGRECKSLDELAKIKEVQRVAEGAMNVAKDMISHSLIGCENVLYYNSMALTSEWVKREISLEFARNNCSSGEEPIVVCGDSCLDVHNTGKGALKAHQSIIIDIFPRSSTTRYFSDMTRTFVKGKAPEPLLWMYSIVKRMKQYYSFTIRPGMTILELTDECKTAFEGNGYRTYDYNGVMQGFFHSLGHGIGLDIHENPGREDKIKAGNVIAVEPGLYYVGVGGVRLEDIVHITSNGCENLTRFPEELEL